MYFSWIFKSSALIMRILTCWNLILAQNYHDIKNKHWSIRANPSSYISNSLFHHSLAHYLAHRLSIARYCLRFAPHLYIVLLIAFSYVMCLRNYQKELYMSFYRHSHFSYLSSIKSSILIQIVEEVVQFPSHLKPKKDHHLLPNNLISNSWL
jgi:hypothetical protein